MAFTQDDIDRLKAAIGTGASRVRYADNREVQYRSLAEMLSTLSMMEKDVSPNSAPISRVTVAGF